MIDLLDAWGKGLICFTGGGGKTTLMLRLADELRRSCPVIVTTTTKMGIEEVEPRDALVGEVSPAAVQDVLERSGRAFLFREIKGDRYHGFAPEIVASFRSLAPCVLVEADGARRRPLKGYAEHEPPLPGRFDRQVVVVGVDAFLRPMTEDTVARFDAVRRFLDIENGAMLTPPLLLKLLNSGEMYLKNSPPDAKRVLLLNKADLMEPQDLTTWIDVLRPRLEGYDGIGATSRNSKEFFSYFTILK